MALSKRQRAFIDEYFLCNMKGAEAARRMGSKQPRLYAHRMLTNDNVLAEVDRRLREKQLSADEALARLGDMASSNLSDFAYIGSDSDLAECQQGYLIKKFKRKITRTQAGGEYEEIELELYDAQSALVNILKIHGKFANDAGSSEDKPVFVKFVKGVNPDDL
jgi:hypothetical protein